MDYRKLGRTGLKVSPLIVGTMNFGRRVTEPDAHTIMDRALELGLNFIDTANVYGGKPGEGYTEQIVGRWLSQGGGRREKIVLATKAYRPMGDWPNESKLSARHIKLACEDSLRRLQTDHLDLYQMHHIDRATPWEESWQAMEQLVDEGKVLYVGSSNFAGWHIAQAQNAARARHFMGIVSEQSIYNLTERTLEMEVLPACQGYGLGVIVWSPLAAGVLGGALTKATEGRRAEPDQLKQIEKFRPQLEQYEAFCKDLGEEPANVALAWLLAQPTVTAPIIGPRTIDQLETSLHSIEIKLGSDQLSRLDEIWPGPGPSPEAFAW